MGTRPFPTMESHLSKPADDNVDVEHGDGEQSSQSEMLITVPVEIPVRTTISTKQQNDDSRGDGSEGLNRLDESSEDSDGEQSSQADMPSDSTISRRQQNDDSNEDGENQNQSDDSRVDGSEGSNLFDESSEDSDEEQSSQEGTPVKVPIKKGLPSKRPRTNRMSPLEDAFGKRATLCKQKSIQTIKPSVKKKQKRQSSPQK